MINKRWHARPWGARTAVGTLGMQQAVGVESNPRREQV
jgi:hypothetical protein